MKVVVPSGIGDFSWSYSKLCHLTCKLAVEVAQTGGPLRLAPYAKILPKVRSVGRRSMHWPELKAQAIPAGTTLAELNNMRESELDVFIETNSHLESNKHLRDWLPELPINHHYDINIPKEDVEGASNLVPDGPFIALFASSIATSRAWKAWQEKEWVRLMDLIRRHLGDVDFVLVGAQWDTDLGARIEKEAKQAKLKFTNLVSMTTAGMVIHIISLSKYFVAFPSGLGILADVICAPATMFYANIAPHHGIMGNWADAESIKSLRYHERVFCPPEEYSSWLLHTYKLRERFSV
jgi:ADP-heptose:LPS heptosyltransferase